MQVARSYEIKVRNATSFDDLVEVIQHVFKLEHATLQPYFTAIFSLKPDTNKQVQQHIRWVAMEEMLHMCVVSNLIIALGGAPIIDSADVIPSYPGPLPMGVGDDLVVSLRKYSVDQVQNCFMGIEHPADPLEINDDAVPDVQSHTTLARVYHHLGRKLVELGGPLPGNVHLQVTTLKPYTKDELFPIATVDDATRALEIIVEQGEGTTSSPVSPSGKMAHYYRFQELAVGRRIVADKSAELGYSFTGEKIDFDPDGVWNIAPDTRIADLPEGSDARSTAEQFAHQYRAMLRGLHHAFNGHPDTIHDAVKIMRDLQVTGYKLCATPYPGRDGVYVGPTFEWVD